jgi:hypothetical protein
MIRGVFFVVGMWAVAAFAQEDPTITLRLTVPQADYIERWLRKQPFEEVDVLYHSIQGQITAAANANAQAQRDAIKKSAIEQHDKELEAKAAEGHHP